MTFPRKIRNAVAGLFKNEYPKTKWAWIDRINAELAEFGLQLDQNFNPNNDNGGNNVWVYQRSPEETVGRMRINWYRMESGNYEVVCYLI